MNPQRVLVTGHHGYIGAVLVRMLCQAKHEPVGLDADYFAHERFVGEIPKIPSLHRDLRDVQASDLEGFDAVLHLAALSNDPLGDLNPRLTYEINHVATMRVAQLA